jgi:three-Cys-motif partner protein
LDAELSREVELDARRQLVNGDDGLPARLVALHSADKAHYVRYYADIVGTAMTKAYPGPIVWIELFAGPGQLYVRGLRQHKLGSPLEAMGIPRPFDIYVFADLDPKCVDALKIRVGNRAGVHVLQGDANNPDLHDQIAALVPRNALVVLYADPAGLDLDFSTLRYFAERYRHLDLLVNFPVPGVVRALLAGYDVKAARVLDHDAPLELIGPTSGRSGTSSLREYFGNQLKARLGYNHFDVIQIRLHSNNSPLYDLMLASRESIAMEFFTKAKNRPPGGQVTFDTGC